jgi:hypothetical protein
MGGRIPVATAEPVATQYVEVAAPATLDEGEFLWCVLVQSIHSVAEKESNLILLVVQDTHSLRT